MRKVILGMIVMAVIGISTISCKNVIKEAAKTEEIARLEYQCPMKCEGEKTYKDKDTKCPVCGMSLKVVETGNHDTEENHDDHDH